MLRPFMLQGPEESLHHGVVITNVLRRISRELALRVAERQGHTLTDVGIGPASNYTSGRLMMVDGFTVTAADTEENQAEYPQNPKQKEGLGFPILRGVTLIDMRTGLQLDAEVGPGHRP